MNFKNTILIMTSNIGSDVIQEYMEKVDKSNKETVMDECRQKVIQILKTKVRPEFINRIDEIIMFEPLTEDDIRKILELQISQLRKLLESKGISIEFSEAAISSLAKRGYDPAYGARPIKRLLQKELINSLATALIKGEIDKEKPIYVDLDGGKIKFTSRQ